MVDWEGIVVSVSSISVRRALTGNQYVSLHGHAEHSNHGQLSISLEGLQRKATAKKIVSQMTRLVSGHEASWVIFELEKDLLKVLERLFLVGKAFFGNNTRSIIFRIKRVKDLEALDLSFFSIILQRKIILNFELCCPLFGEKCPRELLSFVSSLLSGPKQNRRLESLRISRWTDSTASVSSVAKIQIRGYRSELVTSSLSSVLYFHQLVDSLQLCRIPLAALNNLVGKESKAFYTYEYKDRAPFMVGKFENMKVTVDVHQKVDQVQLVALLFLNPQFCISELAHTTTVSLTVLKYLVSYHYRLSLRALIDVKLLAQATERQTRVNLVGFLRYLAHRGIATRGIRRKKSSTQLICIKFKPRQ